MNKIKGDYSYKLTWIERDPDWVVPDEWEGQWFYEFFYKNKKIGEAAFVDSESSSYIMPCDFCDLAIEIDPKHQRKGLASFAIKNIQKQTGKILVYNDSYDHSESGLSLFRKNKIYSI